jgi:hypothetical protein
LEAEKAVSFYIYLAGFWNHSDNNELGEIPLTLDNSKTDEKFAITADRFGRVKILRYPTRMDGDTESIERLSIIPNRKYRNVTLNFE